LLEDLIFSSSKDIILSWLEFSCYRLSVTTQPINPWLAAFFLVEIDKTVTFLVDFSGFYTK